MKQALLFIALIALSSGAIATTQDQANKTKTAEAASADWLKLMDSGSYAQSWQQASSTFKAAVTEAQWEQKLRAVRVPLGAVTSRQLDSAEYTTQLPGAPDGEYVVIRYNATFQHKKTAIETVVAMLDKDGQWRISGYFIK